MPSPRKRPFIFWQNKSITVKLSVGLVLLLCFLTVVSFTSDLSMRYVRKADESIWISTEIQRIVLEMNQGMEQARHLHDQFFLQYSKVGLKAAHENFAQPAIRKTAQVVTLSKKLQDIIATAEVSDALHRSHVDLNLFLSSAKRFADTSIEAVQLATKLATPEQGLEAQLDSQLAELKAELTRQQVFLEMFHEMELFILKHRNTRKRFLMQSAFNVSFNLRRAVESHPTITAPKKSTILSLLTQIKEQAKAILETDALIKAKFADFILQEKSAHAVSATLVDLAGKEVEKSQEKISATHKFAQIVLYVVSLLGLLAAGTIAWGINHNITKRIIGLTRVAEKLRKGRLDVTVEDKFKDELGELGQTFNFMSIRLKDLVDNLEQKISQQTKTLQLETERAQNYLDIAGVMLTYLDSSGKIRLINQKGCEILEITEQQALGQNWFEHYLPTRKKNEFRKVFNSLMAGDIHSAEYYENTILTSRGQEKMIAFHNTILTDSDGHIEGVLFSGEDITERKHHEAEREKLEAQLRQAHKMEAIGTLAGGIAHDFNNILTAILGFTELARNDIPKNSPALCQLDEVLNAGNRAKDLVKHILTFSRKESHEQIPVEVNSILKEALRFLRATIPTTIEIKERLDLNCGNIMADLTQIHQIIVNLCTNAAHAMEEKGGILEVSSSYVKLSKTESVATPDLKPGRYAMLTIKDNGSGIAPHYLDRIFDPYFTTKEVGKGSGMGLAVVIGIVQSHDGVITVESKLGKGTTFKVYFPRIAEKVEGQAVEKLPLPVGDEHILIVDDDPSIAKLTQKRLQILGYHATALTNSSECLTTFKAAPNTYDLVITDQTMPTITGEQLARKILLIKPNMPIILCTGYSSSIDAAKARQIGISAFIMKPVTTKELAQTVRTVLDSNRAS